MIHSGVDILDIGEATLVIGLVTLDIGDLVIGVQDMVILITVTQGIDIHIMEVVTTGIMTATEKEIAMHQIREDLQVIIPEEHKIFQIRTDLLQREEVQLHNTIIPEGRHQQSTGRRQQEIAIADHRQQDLCKEVHL